MLARPAMAGLTRFPRGRARRGCLHLSVIIFVEPLDPPTNETNAVRGPLASDGVPRDTTPVELPHLCGLFAPGHIVQPSGTPTRSSARRHGLNQILQH